MTLDRCFSLENFATPMEKAFFFVVEKISTSPNSGGWPQLTFLQPALFARNRVPISDETPVSNQIPTTMLWLRWRRHLIGIRNFVMLTCTTFQRNSLRHPISVCLVLSSVLTVV